MKLEKQKKNYSIQKTKEVAYTAVFTALLIGAQIVLSGVAGVEIVTALFFSYAFMLGGKRASLAGVAFAFLRQLIFGFYVNVFLLYVIYFPIAGIAFGWMGKRGKPVERFPWAIVVAIVCAFLFTLIDDVVTPLWYGFGGGQTIAYFYASIPIMLMQAVSVGITMAVGFLPLCKAFGIIKRNLS